MSQKKEPEDRDREEMETERNEILVQLEEWIEIPMMVLGFVWLILIGLELVRGIGPRTQGVITFIWVLFLLEFTLKLAIAPDRSRFLRSSWLTVISLIVPALRVFRIAQIFRVLRMARAARGMTLVKVIGSLNRAIRNLRAHMGHLGFGYLVLASVIITLLGAAGMFAFERHVPDKDGLHSYGDALWWTGMIMTTLGSQYWPKTGEGRVLGFLLSLYALGVFGYITATLATFFIGRDLSSKPENIQTMESLHDEIKSLREEIRAMSADKLRD
jgi:voltage-gated potassium channel